MPVRYYGKEIRVYSTSAVVSSSKKFTFLCSSKIWHVEFFFFHRLGRKVLIYAIQKAYSSIRAIISLADSEPWGDEGDFYCTIVVVLYTRLYCTADKMDFTD